MDPDQDLHTHLRELEESLLLPEIRQSARVAELLADDFVEFGSSGRTFNKEKVIASMRAAAPVKVSAVAFKVRTLGPDVALVTYVAVRCVEPPVRTLRSSLWRRTGSQWQMTFHQGTVSPPESLSIGEELEIAFELIGPCDMTDFERSPQGVDERSYDFFLDDESEEQVDDATSGHRPPE